MTVCIAAICESGKKIVCVSDQLVTFFPTMTAIDGATTKDQALHKNWFSLYAADDIGDVRPVIERAAILMVAKQRDLALTEAIDIFTESYAKRHQDLIEFRVLRPNGFEGFDDFNNRALTLPPDEYRRIKRLMNKTKPGCEFLVTGFDLMGLAHIFKQDSSGPAQGFDDPGWWAIGCGAPEAISALEFYAHRQHFTITCSEAMCIYNLLSAKFMAEANRLVGRETFITCHAFNEPTRYMHEPQIEAIRKEWEKCAIPRIPKGMIRRIPKFLVTDDDVVKAQEQWDDLERRLFGRKSTKPVQ